MANRCLLHHIDLEKFKEWLCKNGWMLETPKGFWEVLRARKDGRKDPLIIYERYNSKQHYTVMDRDVSIVRKFISDKE